MTDSAVPFLAARSLSIGFRSSRSGPLIKGFSFELGAGVFVCLLGPNGAGKSTLLRTLAGLHPPLAGEIRLEGRPIGGIPLHEMATRRAVMTSDRYVAADLRVDQLIALGRHPYTDWRGRLGDDDRAAVRDAIDSLNLAPFAARRVAELSDGERQRVLLARALAQQTPLMLLDEPTAYLDVARRRAVFAMLRERSRNDRRTIIASTHDLDSALRYADVAWLLPPGGPIRIAQPSELMNGDAVGAVFGEAAASAEVFTGDGDGI